VGRNLEAGEQGVLHYPLQGVPGYERMARLGVGGSTHLL
jgi:hypothetical protein